MIKYKSPYSEEETPVYLKHGTYANGGTPSMQLMDANDHFPFMTCTVNMPGLEMDELAIKNYSENEGLLEFLVEEGVLEEPHRYVESGFVMIPVCRRK
jgi:hypothetical protein